MRLSHAEIKKLTVLKRKKYRQAEGLFLCDGVRLLEEAEKSNYHPEKVYYSAARLNERGLKLVKSFERNKIAVHDISVKDIERIVSTKSSQGIVGVFKSRKYNLEQHLNRGMRRLLVCDNINDPGNLGTLMRSAAAFGLAPVITSTKTVEINNPKTMRASMGACFSQPFIEKLAPELIVEKLKESGYKLLLADINGENLNNLKSLPGKLALIIGSEAVGGDDVFENNADYAVRIPMSKNVESLNAAMAGTALMFWLNNSERTSS
ncbi:MAG: RNA methyltransferase [candidate division Zixibacteria bacterium]